MAAADSLPRLPAGYRLDFSDPDVPTLLAPNRKTVARFGLGATPEAIEEEAWGHLARADRAVAELEALLERRRS